MLHELEAGVEFFPPLLRFVFRTPSSRFFILLSRPLPPTPSVLL